MADHQKPSTTWSYVKITSSTNIGPMTTPFKFPSDCTNLYDFHTTVLGQPDWSTLYTGGCVMSSCCPYSAFYTTDRAWYSSYYSPAVCPQGYQTCDGPWEVASALQTNEHVRFCCPTYVFPLAESFWTILLSLAISGYSCPLWSGYAICETARTAATSALVVDNISFQHVYSTEVLPSPTDEGVPYDYAYPLQIRWKDSDFANTSKSNTSTLARSTSNATSTYATSTQPASTRPMSTEQILIQPTSPPTGSSSSNTLAAGAIAGIAVGLSVLAVASIGVLLIWIRTRRARQTPADPVLPDMPELYEKRDFHELDPSSRPYEAPNTVSSPSFYLGNNLLDAHILANSL